MLDPKGTFDDLVLRYSDSSEQAEDIKVNRIYRNLTGSLSGTQEYMAMEKLYELVEEGGFDLVVVDTPPSRNALDFLDAPRRLTRFWRTGLFQALMLPTRAGFRIMGVAAQALLRTISKVAGADIVGDAGGLLPGLRGDGRGFRNRATRVRELLVQADTAFILVASPRPDSVDEAVHFAGKLAESEMSVHRAGGQPGAAPVRRRRPSSRRSLAWPATLPILHWASWWRTSAATPRPLTAEERAYADLVSKVAPAPVYRVPLLNPTCTTSTVWGTIADLLFADAGARGGAPSVSQ